MTELEAEPDGLIAKPVGIWSLWKLAALHLYFSAFTTACKSVDGGHYIDGFAGPGLCRVRYSNPPYTSWGSPLLALRTEPKFEVCHFIELDPKNADALKDRTAKFGNRSAVHAGDVNERVAQLIASEVPSWAPCFCLLDQQGGELEWRTVEAISRVPGRKNKPELMILYPLRMALIRLLSVAAPLNPAFASRWDSTLGTGEWREIYGDRRAGRIDPAEAERRYLALYESRLRGLNYKHVASRVIEAPRAPGQRRQGMYHLVFATDSDIGFKIMTDVFKRPYSLESPVTQQPNLFE